MENKFISLIAIILGIIILVFPLTGVIETNTVIGVSIFVISIFLLVMGGNLLNNNKIRAFISLIIGIFLLILSIAVIFDVSSFSFLTQVLLYLGALTFIISGAYLLINQDTKFGFYPGVIGIVLGLIYIVASTFVTANIIHGVLIGLWLIIAGGSTLMR